MKFTSAFLLLVSAFSMSNAQTIPEIAIANGSFETLVAALGAAELVDTVGGEGPFTVFAPTDDAFAALPAGLVDCLLIPDNKAALSAILTYHVVSGKVMSTDLTDGMMAPTVQGESITVDLTDGVKINESVVSTPDVEADNGVIHIIDSGTFKNAVSRQNSKFSNRFV